MGSVTRIEQYGRDGRLKLGHMDMWHVYTAYAPMDDGRVLVKVGISVVPHNRLVSLHCNCPFPIEMAAFVDVGRKKQALAVERGILGSFPQFKTRGEWLAIPNDAENRKAFASKCRAIVEVQTRKPCKWRKVSREQIAASISASFRKFDMGG